MKPTETLADFYQRHGRIHSPAGQFNAYRVEEGAKAIASPYTRRNFYKILLLTQAHGTLSYADKTIDVKDGALLFSNPLIPYAWERKSGSETGFVCLFTEEFINPQLKIASVAGSPLFKVGGQPVLFPAPATVAFLSTIFERFLAEWASDYPHKNDLLRNYVQIILHEALKIAPPDQPYAPGTSAARISTLFLDLLDRQFPLASPQDTLLLKNANEFARQLAVHPNHLNKVLKETTGKTTTEHLAGKVAGEAKALLQHSDWPIAAIAQCLGFAHVSNFNSFFKKQTGQPPAHFRKQPRVIS